MGCCGRPDNRQNKGAKEYYQKYAYLSSHQQEQAEKLMGTIAKCENCDALTMTSNNNCVICGKPKDSKDQSND